jgi:hypothetical protein
VFDIAAIRSQRLRAFFFELSLSRLRTSVVARHFWQVADDMGRGRYHRFLPSIDSEAEVNIFRLGQFRGPAGWREGLHDWRETISVAEIKLMEFIDRGTKEVVLVLRGEGSGASSGLSLAPEGFSFVLRVENGQAVRGALYATREEALVAARDSRTSALDEKRRFARNRSSPRRHTAPGDVGGERGGHAKGP